ncbi:Fc receptor-like protein 3 [Archocentrus centrarchus]|uniref:Fc receptor-like protein 3 n=1 Tax=Archocentrus centrarchus TaxID=63155 RepID=UPI0011EA1CDF|nr:Fc receptor-like protein 3 [Archocentrus centrarchus]
METMTLCTIIASLRIFPSRCQFFMYESVALSCGHHKSSSDWTIRRNTFTNTNEECFKVWGKRNESHCYIQDVYLSDSGVYWCESGVGTAAGACSEAVNITVTGGLVILESPVHPVQEGDAVTLRCTNKSISFSSHANFYKDGLFIGNSSTGIVTIHKVSKSDEGFYKCNIYGAGSSPASWLAVRGQMIFRLFNKYFTRCALCTELLLCLHQGQIVFVCISCVEGGRPESFETPLTHDLLPVLGVSLSLALVVLLLVLLL